MLSQIRRLNPGFSIHELASPAFRPFGRVIEGMDFSPLIEKLKGIATPEEGNIYVADEPLLRIEPLAGRIGTLLYGGMDIEIGYCNGHSHSLNGLEYHKGSEVNFAAAPAVMMLAHLWDVADNAISTDKVSLFFVPAGTVMELYATTLHLAPCAVDAAGFKMGVILPARTNLPLPEGRPAEDPTLFAINKWLLVHPDSPQAARGAHIGVGGPNLTLNIAED